MDNLNEKLLDGKPKKIGLLGDTPVLQYRTKGGLYMVVTQKSTGGMEIFGVGPHRQIARVNARRVAAKRGEDMVFSELSKSDHLDLDAYAYLMPEYAELTDKLRRANGDE